LKGPVSFETADAPLSIGIAPSLTPGRMPRQTKTPTAGFLRLGDFPWLPIAITAPKVGEVIMPLSIELEVLNELGLHARPASEFVRCAQSFKNTVIRIRRGEETFVATSILEVLSANLDQGTVFILEADGPEAAQALEAAAALMVHFREDEERTPRH
jgi:phosphocarrier protein HPr